MYTHTHTHTHIYIYICVCVCGQNGKVVIAVYGTHSFTWRA